MSELGNRTTTDEVLEGVDLTGRRILVTGGAVGLGRRRPASPPTAPR